MRPMYFLLVAVLAVAPSSVFGQSPLQDCAAQFIGGQVENAPTIGSSSPTEPYRSNRHLCYRDDGASFFAIEYWPEQFAPRWAAYRLDPANYGLDGCKTYTRNTANCYFKEKTWADFQGCEKGSDPFHPDHMLSGDKLGSGDFSNTGHDRGHVAPRQAFSWHVCGTYQTFSMANMSPQRALLNQKIWQYLERQVLTWAVDEGPIYVVTGTTFKPFPHSKFRVYTGGTLDHSKIYSPDISMLAAVEQHRVNFTSHPRGHILRPDRNANPSKVKNKVRDLRLPTGYYKVVFRPAAGDEPAHAIGFLLPHTFESLNAIPGFASEETFWAFVSTIDLIEETSGTRFPGISEDLKRSWGDGFFLSRHTGRNIRSKSCGRGSAKGVVEGSTKDQRIAFCSDKLN